MSVRIGRSAIDWFSRAVFAVVVIVSASAARADILTYTANLDPKQVATCPTPPGCPPISQATGQITVQIDTTLETITSHLTWSNLTGPADRSHLHSGPEGTPSDGMFFHEVITDPYRTIACQYGIDGGWIGCAPTTGSLDNVLDVLAYNGGVSGLGYWNCPTFQCIVDLANGGNMYIDMHTEMYPDGEIRGQLMPSSTISSSTLSGTVFYDGSRDGTQNSGETGIKSVTLHVTDATTMTALPDVTTNASGAWSSSITTNHLFKVCEALDSAPLNTTLWELTAPAAGSGSTTSTPAPDSNSCWTGLASANTSNLNFGDVGKITGKKYYDANANGSVDGGESTINGFRVSACFDANCPGTVTAAATTANGGKYSFYLPKQNSTYRICETTLPNNATWLQTGPLSTAISGNATVDSFKCWKDYTTGGPQGGLDLLNVCVGTGGGQGSGYWTNKNPQALLVLSDFAALTALHLRNANGTDMDFSTTATLSADKSALNTWILNANATNMAYMLSAQLAAMKLNVLNALVSGTALVYTPGAPSANAAGFESVNQLMADADLQLANNPVTMSGNPNRTIQETIKNALEKANGNSTFVLSSCPAPTYPL